MSRRKKGTLHQRSPNLTCLEEDLCAVDVAEARYHLLAHKAQSDGLATALHLSPQDLWIGVLPQRVLPKLGYPLIIVLCSATHSLVSFTFLTALLAADRPHCKVMALARPRHAQQPCKYLEFNQMVMHTTSWPRHHAISTY